MDVADAAEHNHLSVEPHAAHAGATVKQDGFLVGRKLLTRHKQRIQTGDSRADDAEIACFGQGTIPLSAGQGPAGLVP